MRIAYVINSVEGGGAAFPVPAIVGALRACGADVEVFALTCRDGRALPAMIAAGLSCRVREGGEKDHFAAYAWLNRSIGAFDADIIWTSLTRATLLGQLVGARRRIPVASWQHAAFLRPANCRLLRVSRGLTALWIADSVAVADFTVGALGVERSRLVTWPLFAADEGAPRASPWRPGMPLRIASLGRLHRVKGYGVLIAALARLAPGAHPHEVMIGGDGEEREALVALAIAAGLSNVTFAGFVGDPQAFLATQHLYVQPSRSEGFCVAAHQAMQAGLPVVGSNVGEMAHSIADGRTGLLVPAGDVAELANALQQCLADPGALHMMGDAGRDRLVTRFSADRFQAGAEAILQQLAGFSRPGRLPVPQAIDRST